MAQYQAPGVYVEEVAFGPPPISGVSTSTAGFIGVARKGPVNKPTLVISIGEFEAIFGEQLESDYEDKRWLGYAVQGFFENGGQLAYVTRVSNLPETEEQIDRTTYAFAAETMIPDRNDAYRQLAQDAKVDDDVLALTFTEGLGIDSVLIVGEGQSAEEVRVKGFTGGVQIKTKLRHTHSAKTPVVLGAAPAKLTPDVNLKGSTETYPAGATELYLDAVADVAANRWLVLEDSEIVRVAATPGTAGVAIAPALGVPHDVGDTVKIFSEPAAAPTLTFEDRTPVSKSTSFVAPSAAGVAQGVWLMIGTGDEREAVKVTAIAAGATPADPVTVTIGATKADWSEAAPVAILTDTTKTTTLARPAWLPLNRRPASFVAGQAIITWEQAISAREALLIGAGAPLDLTGVAGGPFLVPLSAPPAAAHADTTEVREINPIAADATLTDATPVNATEIPVSDASALLPGSMAEISDGKDTEIVLVAGPGSKAGSVALQSRLRLPHAPGTGIRSLADAVSLHVYAGPSRPDPGRHPNVGAWAHDVDIDITPAAVATSIVQDLAIAGTASLNLKNAKGIRTGSMLSLPGNRSAMVSRVEGNTVYIDGTLEANVASESAVATIEFNLAFTYRLQAEVFTDLSLDPRHPRFVEKIVNGTSQLVRVKSLKDPAEGLQAADLPRIMDNARMGGGSDPVEKITDAVVIGQDAQNADDRSGIKTFLNTDDVSMLAAPGWTSEDVQGALINYCETTKYCFAVLDSAKGADIDGVKAQKEQYDSKYAALYYPWIEILDLGANERVLAPPTGYVMGIYARTDAMGGPHLAPANQVVSGATDLERLIGTAQQSVLNPKGINVIRALPGRGIRVWGARTVSSDALWRYINVRRLFIFLEKSIDLSTQGAVFQPNDQFLWSGLKATVTDFLTSVWRNGALQGATAKEAFFVQIGLGTTMTQLDIDNGYVIMVIGVAPVKPAEFVVFRIGQKVGGATVSE